MATLNNILVVDDTTVLLDLAESFISFLEPNLKTFFASNGKEALELMKNQSIDALLTDINMPLMGGIALLKALKKGKDYLKIPAYAMTGNLIQNFRGVMEAGAYGLLSKPFDVDDFKLMLDLMKSFKSTIHRLTQPLPGDTFGFDSKIGKPEEGIYTKGGLYFFQRNVPRELLYEGMNSEIAQNPRKIKNFAERFT